MKIYLRILIGFGVLVMFSAVAQLVNLYMQNSIVNAQEWYNHSQLVLNKAHKLETEIVELESDMRGFAITGNRMYLDLVKEHQAYIPVKMAKLKEFVTDNKLQAHNVEDVLTAYNEYNKDFVQVMVNKRLAMGARLLASERDFMDPFLKLEGRQRILPIRKGFESLYVIEESLRDQRMTALKSTYSQMRTLTWITLILMIAGGFIVAYYIAGYLRRRVEELNETVSKIAAGDLRTRVDDRADDELRPLVRSVNHMAGQLDTAFKEIQSNYSELEQFSWISSHDMKEPVRMINIYTEEIARRNKDSLDEVSTEFMRFVRNGAVRLQALIDSMLNYGRVGRNKAPKETVNLAEMVQGIEGDLGAILAESGGSIRQDLRPETLLAEPVTLRQVMYNLMHNGLKYRKADVPPVITITGRSEGENYHVSVADNGIGIHKDYWDKVFLIFQRLHTNAEYEGTGIGLALCKKVIEGQGGRIWVEGEEGKGAVFHFTLPHSETGKFIMPHQNQ